MLGVMARATIIFVSVFIVLCANGRAIAQEYTWVTYENTRFGFRVTYPANLFLPQDPPANNDGRGFVSADGAAQFSVSASFNTEQLETIDQYKAMVLEAGDYGNITYQPSGRSWFVLSGYRGPIIFYEKYIMSCNRQVLNMLSLTYPQTQRELFDPVAAKLEENFKAGNGYDNPPESCN